jgi:L-lysine 2,3-aminomutase
MQYQAYNINNFKSIPQIKMLTAEQIAAIEVVGSVLPFKTNNYVVDRLIDWSRVPEDPMFVLTFPQKGMLRAKHYDIIERLIKSGADKTEIKKAAEDVRLQLNPHPAGQIEHNVPIWHGEVLGGFQHKYRETVVFFPSQGQTCHAYCTFCFRWPQFVGMEGLKFASKESQLLVDYVSGHPDVTDVLFTGGDPLIMKTRVLSAYIKPLLEADIPHLHNIRIGTKALTYWPDRFLADDDATELLTLFREVKDSGKHLAFMAHFNHPVEQIWSEMWRKQVSLGCIPYYMFVARNTGAQHYFSIPLENAWQIFREAYQMVSGICRTVRGPVMSCLPGKVQILGVTEIQKQKLLTLKMIQGRNPDWVARPFFCEYDDKAIWYTDLKPAFGENKFFFTDELNEMLMKDHEVEAEDFE